jgi:hypothetical protein
MMAYQFGIPKKQETLAAIVGSLVVQFGMKVFLTAWLVDIVYDVFAPADLVHFGYWTAVQMTLLFLLVTATVTGRPEQKAS